MKKHFRHMLKHSWLLRECHKGPNEKDSFQFAIKLAMRQILFSGGRLSLRHSTNRHRPARIFIGERLCRMPKPCVPLRRLSRK